MTSEGYHVFDLQDVSYIKTLPAQAGAIPSTLNNWLKLGLDIPADRVIPICEFIDESPMYLLSGKEPVATNIKAAETIFDPDLKNMADVLASLQHEMVLVTCSYTVGSVMFVPKRWDNWAMTCDIIRLVPQNDIAWFVYTWLQPSYAKKTLKAMAYGSAIQHIEISHLEQMPFKTTRHKSRATASPLKQTNCAMKPRS